MSAPAAASGIPLPELPPLAALAPHADDSGHPVYAALLAELVETASREGPVVARYEDAP
ncbi:hypothetical protein JQK87_36840 [Streptomyces sp. G44]|uniref:hypothetical protein n=1 Tax=Streptomyces sp. G44 TaxID=2807632 RepID=UPI001961D8F6|nr:hypothetical protein [Streptomyces sp. G44]MBM7173841.1 hypothetical protein [Streptomyces sp. G44]